MSEETLIPLFLLSLIPNKGVNGNEKPNGNIKPMRENYKLIYDSTERTAALYEESFEWKFADGKKRYLRLATLRHTNKIAHVTLLVIPKLGVPWTQSATLDASPTHPSRGDTRTHIYSWVGDHPILAIVRMVVQENDVGDVLRPCIVYEEQP